MKRTITITLILALLTMAGCFSIGGRKPIGENIVGGNLDDAGDSLQQMINSEEMAGKLGTIADTGKLVQGQGKAIQDELEREAPSGEVIGAAAAIVVEGAATIQAEAKAAEELNKDQKALAKRINKRAQGKRRWSWGRLLLIWVLVIIALGIGLRFTPFFPVFERVVSGIAHLIIDVWSGAFSRARRNALLHLSKTKTIATADLDLETQADIKIAEAKALKVRAKNGG